MHWQLIAAKLKNTKLDGDCFKSVLDYFCRAQGISVDSSSWNYREDLIFQNSQFEVDLKTWNVRLPHTSSTYAKLPQALTQDEFIKDLLADEDLTALNVFKEQVGKTTLYSFKDHKGVLTQIEEADGKYSFYKQFDIEGTPTWIQRLDLTPKPKAIEKDKTPGLLEMYSTYKKKIAQDKMRQSSLPFLEQGIYVDPVKPGRGYALDPSGTKISFALGIKKKSKDLIVDKVWDYREPLATGPWEVFSGAFLKDKSLICLKGFENKKDMVLWSQKGSLKRVELPRYGLSFALENGKLMCQTKPYSGYFINPDATDFDKRGLSHALILEHPDPQKTKKLLIPDASVLYRGKKTLKPKASGFGKISLFFHYLGLMSDLIKHQISPPVVKRPKTEYSNAKSLNFTAFDLRPFTGEICKTSSTWPHDLLELLRHASFTNQAHMAASCLKDFPFKTILTDSKLLKKLIEFVNQNTKAGSKAALNVKISLKLLKVLSEHKKLKKNVKVFLQKIILDNGKVVLSQGRQVSIELQLNAAERTSFANLLRKNDPVYLEKHMDPYFRTKGTVINSSKIEIPKKVLPLKSAERIENLEAIINPSVPLQDSELGVKIERLAVPEALLFTPDKIKKQELFTSNKIALPQISLVRTPHEKPYETVALDSFQQDLDAYKQVESNRDHFKLKKQKRRIRRFIENKLLPKVSTHETAMQKLKSKIEKRLRVDTTVEKQVAILACETHVATFDELREALVQGRLKDLQDRRMIPANYDLNLLEDQLISYFDALAKRNIAVGAISLLERMQAQGPEDKKNWQLMSDDLYRLLTLERKYDPKKNPRFLVFEAQLGLNFKQLSGGLNQFDLLENLLANPSMLVQAPTGAGKTSVLSLLESLLKATGNNLVIQKVLPSLFNQTNEKAREVIGGLFNTLVMPLRFNLKMPLTKNEIHSVLNDKGLKEEKPVDVSLFKGLYEELCEVIVNKGCVLTDYTSLPMMEAKFLQIGQQLVECSISKTAPTALQIEHFTYLKKILVLLRNKGLECMDEFDQPNRPIQKIQLDLQLGATDVPPFYLDTALEIYDILAKDPSLGLTKNIQADISHTTLTQAKENTASAMAKILAPKAGGAHLANGLEQYFLGAGEAVLKEIDEAPSEIQDQVAYCKDQFTLFLSLSLNAKEGSEYERSEDGSKTVPCQKGIKHDAKHGTLYEQINYNIQDYKQAGIKPYDLKAWFSAFKVEWDSAQGDLRAILSKQFSEVFSGLTVVQVAGLIKTEAGLITLVDLVNQDQAKILKFLTFKIQQLKSSGYLISLDPLNVAYMSRAISGISATSGAPDSFHKQFKQDQKAVGQIKAAMAYRMLARADNPNTVIPYDPEHPEILLTQNTYNAIIDGAGAFNGSTMKAATALLAANSHLKQVGYHEKNDAIVYEGIASSNLVETGFVFNQAHTRGTDIALSSNAHALLLVNEKEGFRGLTQEEGRLRGEGQTYSLAMPKDQAAVTLAEVITRAECVDALQDAKDIYRHCCQDPRADLRDQKLQQLLATSSIEEFVDHFKVEACNSLFISKPEKSYRVPGSFYADHKHIRKEDMLPQDALLDLYKQNKLQADALKLPLNAPLYPPELLAKMPPLVSPVTAEVECELQVEVEMELEAEVEVELELERNVETQEELEESQEKGKTEIFYPPRLMPKVVKKASVQEKIHPAYDPALFVTEAFLPFERNKSGSKFKKEPFQTSMFNIKEIYFKTDKRGIVSTTLEDPLRDHYLRQDTHGFIYDLGLEKVVYQDTWMFLHDVNCNAMIQSPVFHNLIAQIKFLDGRISGYSKEELHALRSWLTKNGPAEMKRHLLQEVLLYRYREKERLETSQLGALFNELIP